MNKVILVGRLAQDPEIKYTQAGKCVANFNLAVNRYGNQQEADFIRIVLWEKLAELAGNSLNKGSKMFNIKSEHLICRNTYKPSRFNYTSKKLV